MSWNGSLGSNRRNNYYKTYGIKKLIFHKKTEEKGRKVDGVLIKNEKTNAKEQEKLQDLKRGMRAITGMNKTKSMQIEQFLI